MVVPPTGWYVEIDHASGATLTPDIVDDPQRDPTANDYQRIRVPVRKDSKWDDAGFESQPMRVWEDGERAPIDRLDTVTQRAGETVLEGRGPTALDGRVQQEIEVKQAHKAAEDVLQAAGVTADVDAPPGSVEQDVLQADADTTAEWTDFLQSIPDTSPAFVSGGKLQNHDSAYVIEAETLIGNDASDGNASDGSAADLDSTALSGSTTVTIPYTIPEEHAGVGFRLRNPDDPDTDGDFEGFGFAINIGATTVADFAADWVGSDTYGWSQRTSLSTGDLSGDITVQLDAVAGGTRTLIDAIVVYDTRFSYTWDNSVGPNGYLSGPETKPSLVEVATVDSTVSRLLVGATLTSSWNDVSNQQSVALSNDRGQTWTTASNTDTVTASYSDTSAFLRARFGISRTDDTRTTQTPTTGFNSQTVDVASLFADLDPSPLLVKRTDDAAAMAVLQRYAEYADALFCAVWDDSSGAIKVIWTHPGQRTAADIDDVSGFEWSKSTEAVVETCVVKGSGQQVREESVTADHGTAVALAHDNVIHGREVVYDPDTGTEYSGVTDYDLDGLNGELTTLAAGNISDGQSLAIDYQFRPTGSHTNPGVTGTEIVRDIAGLTTERGCDQAARQIAQQLDDPLREATVTVVKDRVGWNIAAARAFGPLPEDRAYEINAIESTVAEQVFSLASRDSIGDVVGDIRSDVEANTQRT